MKKNFFNRLKITKVLALLLFIPIIGYSQYYNDVLSYSFNGTPTNGVKIHTNMPFVSNQQMPTIMIEGYNYGTGTPIDIKIVYYIYNDEYFQYKATSTSSYTPDIYLSEEGGKVVIFIDDQSYFLRFHVRVYAHLSEQASWFTGWTHSDTPKAPLVPTGHEALVSYDNPNQDDNVLIGLNSPAYGVKIKANFPGYTGGWARGFNIANHDNTENHIQFGSLGNATNGIDQFTYGYIGKEYNDTYMVFKPNGNVGIGATDPKSKLDIGTNYSDPSTYPNKITLWSGGPNNYFGFGISSSDLDYFSQDNHRFYTGYNGTPGSEKMVIKSNGNVGIGATDPKSKLDIGTNYSDPSTYPNKITLWSGGPNNYFGFGISNRDLDYFSQDNHRFYTGYNGTPGSEKMVIKSNGNVGIGTTTPDNKLDVNGTIRAKEIKVESGWSDYVFYENYKLPTLEEEEKHIEENGHLLGFESEQDMEGMIHLGDVSRRQQAKIEEMMLHLIQINEKLQNVEAKVTDLEQENTQLKEQLTERK